jgi:hypothetical protein
MTQHTAFPANKAIGGLLVAVVANCSFAAAALGPAPAANATCASFFGIGNSANCFSNLTSVAIAVGDGASAYADGLFGGAFSLGNNAEASTGTGPSDRSGALDLAVAIGDNAGAGTGGSLAFGAVILGTGYNGAQAGDSTSFGSIAIVLGGSGTVSNVNVAATNGVGNIAIDLFGSQNIVAAFDTVSSAFSVGGSNTGVYADGPLAVSGSILQTNAVITKTGPGFNINGFKVGAAAATGRSKAAGAAGGAESPRPAAGADNKPHATTGRRTSR